MSLFQHYSLRDSFVLNNLCISSFENYLVVFVKEYQTVEKKIISVRDYFDTGKNALVWKLIDNNSETLRIIIKLHLPFVWQSPISIFRNNAVRLIRHMIYFCYWVLVGHRLVFPVAGFSSFPNKILYVSKLWRWASCYIFNLYIVDLRH